MAKDEPLPEASQQEEPRPRPRGARTTRTTAAPAAVEGTPSAEEAAAIAASTVFEPDPAPGAEPEVVPEVEAEATGSDADDAAGTPETPDAGATTGASPGEEG
jgi:hypothetical protein